MTINISNLTKSYGQTVACHIDSLNVGNGEILGLVGNNGAGKTTLFRLMLDLLKPDSGKVCFDGGDGKLENVATNGRWKEFTGAFLDESFLIDFLTPKEYFNFLATIADVDKEDMEARLGAFASFAGDDMLSQKTLIRNLSAGNKQKVGIVAAFVRNPQLVVLDEPFNFLDPTSQNQLKHIIRQYHDQHNATVLLSSHNLTHTVDISSRIVLLEHGKVIRDIPNNGDGKAEKELIDYFKVD